ncbi:hypothetical protein [Candidatus Methylomirabilis limnetica]|nr:hypothetical protein [Candidatus Methylomirabilis limnetica]
MFTTCSRQALRHGLEALGPRTSSPTPLRCAPSVTKAGQTQIAAAISRIEHNAGNVTIETLLKVPRVLGSSLDIRLTAA